MMNDEAGSDTIITFQEDIATTDRPNPLPVGEYPGEIREAAKKTSNTSGKDYAQLNVFVDPSAYPADYADGNPDGTILNYNRLSLQDTKAARWRIRDFFEKMGLPAPGRQLDLNTLVGLKVKARVSHRNYEGQPQAQLDSLVKMN